ncbi:MAG: prepilin-type N-terminal cleavage/methylation domain-containing protein [Acidobacteriota bacterium]
MMNRIRNRKSQGGFTLIELLIVVAIIGIIAAILIPNLIDALQKAKQKRSVADVRTIGTAWMSWLTDAAGSSAAGSAATYTWLASNYEHSDLQALLRPSDTFFYMQEVPRVDGWGNNYGFGFIGTDANLLSGSNVMAIRSLGRDLTASAGTYTPGPFIATDYDQDIVWADGYFVRYPSGSAAASGAGS